MKYAHKSSKTYDRWCTETPLGDAKAQDYPRKAVSPDPKLLSASSKKVLLSEIIDSIGTIVVGGGRRIVVK